MLRLRVVSQLGHPPTHPLEAHVDAVGTIGRSPDCSLVLPDPRRHISREQARIERAGKGYRIRCTGSASSILVNGAELQPGDAAVLNPGDSLIISEYEIAVQAMPPEVSAPSPVSNPIGSPADPLQALGLAPVPIALSGTSTDPLGLSPSSPELSRTPAMSKPAPAAAPSRFADPLGLGGADGIGTSVVDPLGLAPSAQPVLDASRRGGDNLDALFGLEGAPADPLRPGSGLAAPISWPNTAVSDDPLLSLSQTPVAPAAPVADHTPEIAGSFRLPQIIPPTSFGFDSRTASDAGQPRSTPGAAGSQDRPLPPGAGAFREMPSAPGHPGTPESRPAVDARPKARAEDQFASSVSRRFATQTDVVQPEPSEEQIRAIARDAAARHIADFEPPPKTQPTALLDRLNQEQLERLRGQTAAASAGALPSAVAPGNPDSVAGAGTDRSAERFDLLKALLLGLGLSELPRPPLAAKGPPPELTPELMRRLGELTRVSAQGTIDLLQARATLKREMKTEVTMISARDNNPLKFSPDAQAALIHLLSTQSIRGFLDPVPALEDAYQDLLAHQLGFIAGMRAAMQGLITRFDPVTLESRLTRKSVIDSMLPVARRAKLWELFTELFADISREAEDDFEALFGREFVRAYEAQIERLKREASR